MQTKHKQINKNIKSPLKKPQPYGLTPSALIAPDPEHSIGEEREWIIGESSQGKLLVVVYTQTGETIRIISARPATKREQKQYAQFS